MCVSHDNKVATIQWCPLAPVDDTAPRILASGSFDFTVRLWDTRSGSCLYSLKHHVAAIYSLDFTSNGRFLSSGSFDFTDRVCVCRSLDPMSMHILPAVCSCFWLNLGRYRLASWCIPTVRMPAFLMSNGTTTPTNWLPATPMRPSDSFPWCFSDLVNNDNV
jgi:WD40 repeat protein